MRVHHFFGRFEGPEFWHCFGRWVKDRNDGIADEAVYDAAVRLDGRCHGLQVIVQGGKDLAWRVALRDGGKVPDIRGQDCHVSFAAYHRFFQISTGHHFENLWGYESGKETALPQIYGHSIEDPACVSNLVASGFGDLHIEVPLRDEIEPVAHLYQRDSQPSRYGRGGPGYEQN